MAENPFIGTWRIISFEFRAADGSVNYPYGVHPRGYIFYTADGYMSVMIMQANRPNFRSSDLLGGSLEEKARAMETVLTYCGRYEIQGNEVVHQPEASLFPNWTGGEVRRFYQFEDGRLILTSTPQVFEGKEQTVVIVWERV